MSRSAHDRGRRRTDVELNSLGKTAELPDENFSQTHCYCRDRARSANLGPTLPVLGAQLSGNTTQTVATKTYRFDGTYLGYSTITRGFGPSCTNPNLCQGLIVSGGHFKYPFWTTQGQELYIPGQIRANGSIRGSLEYVTNNFRMARAVRAGISGQIVGQKLQGAETDFRCAHHIVLQKK